MAVLTAATVAMTGCAGGTRSTQVLAKSKVPTQGTAVDEYDPPSLHGDLARAISVFGVDLLEKVADAKGNTVISPFSAYSALGLAEGAADGETLKQMREALRTSGIDPGTADARYADMLAQLQFKAKGTPARLDIANSIWVKSGMEVDRAFIDRDTGYYGAQIAQLDMASKSAPDVINAWVKRNTGGRIDKLIDRLDPRTIAVLCNAVYFKDAWSTAFEKSATEEREFRLSDGTTVEVPTMAGPAEGSYIDTGTFQAVALATKGGASFWVFVPKGDNRPTDVLSELKSLQSGGATLQSVSKSAQGQIYLPKFDVEWKGSLKDPLMALGMQRPFDATTAEFPHLTPETADVVINDVVQAATTKIDEQGFEAAAATEVEMRVTAGLADQPFELRVDRPFVYAITMGDVTLFMGVVNDPR
jgi:serpin B